MTGTGTVVLAGGSGFLGVSLAGVLAASGRSVVILSRRPPAQGTPETGPASGR